MFGIWSKKFRIDTLIFLCSAQRKNMEIFLLPPAGFGGKFEFSLCAQTRTEKLLRGGKLGVAGYGQESLGQAFLKACRIQKDRVLCLQAKPRFMLFHGCKNVPVLVVPRSGTQKMIPKKEKLRKIGRGRGALSFSGRFTYPHAGVSALASCKRKNHPEKSSG